jgi:hypothetical protein
MVDPPGEDAYAAPGQRQQAAGLYYAGGLLTFQN